MKEKDFRIYIFLLIICASSSLLIFSDFNTLFGADTTSPAPAGSTPPPITTPTAPAKPPPQQVPPLVPSPQMPAMGPIQKQPKLRTLEGIFTYPGVATFQNGQWVGSEHIYNLTPDLGVLVEVDTPAPQSQLIKGPTLVEKIEPIFKEVGIFPRTSFSGDTPLPFFHVIILLNPIEKGYVVYIAGRLFEEVQNKRVNLPPGILWQAITWEKQELNVFPEEQIQEAIEKSVLSIAKAFADRFKFMPPPPPQRRFK